MIASADQSQVALSGRMTECDSAILSVMGMWMEYPFLSNFWLAWVAGIGVNGWLLCRHFRRDDQVSFCVEQRHPIGDGGNVPVGKRYQAPRRDHHLLTGRRFPQDFAIESPRFHIEAAIIP